MPGVDKATARVLVLVVLMLLTAAALRGYLPEVDHSRRDRPAGNPASLIAVVMLLGAGIAIVVLAIIVRPRNRKARGAAEEPPRRFGGDGARPTWRMMATLLAVIVAWCVLVAVLVQLLPEREVNALPAQNPADTSESTADGAARGRPQPREEPDDRGNTFGYLATGTVVFLLAVGAATLVQSRRRRGLTPQLAFADDDPRASAPSAGGSETLARAAELGLAEIENLNREPREAIIACYAAMERALANAPGAVPRDSDTPSEVLARAVDTHALRADSATQLVDLFAEARFSRHVMTEDHREVAVQALELVLGELRSFA